MGSLAICYAPLPQADKKGRVGEERERGRGLCGVRLTRRSSGLEKKRNLTHCSCLPAGPPCCAVGTYSITFFFEKETREARRTAYDTSTIANKEPIHLSTWGHHSRFDACCIPLGNSGPNGKRLPLIANPTAGKLWLGRCLSKSMADGDVGSLLSRRAILL